MAPLLLLLLLLASVRASTVTTMFFQMGEYTLAVTYDPSRPFSSYAMHASTEGSVKYAVSLQDGISDSLVCRRVITKQVLVSPRGCDALSPTDAIVDHFCEFRGTLALRNARLRTLSQWSLRADSPQCTDKATCFGPVYVSSESWQTDEVITDMDLIKSRGGVFVVSTAGAAGEIPMITRIPIVMPKLALYSSCVGYEEIEFEMNAKDNDEGAYVNNTYVYGSGIVRRMRFERSSQNKFRVVLGNKGGGSEFYNDEYVSILEYDGVEDAVNTRVQFRIYANATDSPTQTPTTLNPTTSNAPTMNPTTPNPTVSNAPTMNPTTLNPTVSNAPTMNPTTLTPTNAPTWVCASELILIPAPRPFQLIEPVAPDDLTYYLDRRGYYETSECSRRRGALDETNNLVYPDCPVNAVCGGEAPHRAPGPFGAKFRVEPNLEFKDYEWSCTKFYARSNEFTTIMGSPVNSYAPDLQACNYPFPFPAQIESKGNDVFEKLRQCKMVGGRAALESKAYCTVDVTTTLCRKGWFFFDEFCYYRPDPEKDGRFKTRQEDADEACASIHPKARAATAIDAYTESWLQTSFIFQNPVACGTDPVRALVTGTRCKCYDCPLILNSTLDGTVTECGCETPQFPLCYYRMKDDYLAWNDMKFSPSTLQVLKDGQCMDNGPGCMGNDRYGKELECNCYPGSAGQYCDRRACIVNASTLVGDGLLLKFAQTCEKHGFCDEGQVDVCECLRNYGPRSTFGDQYQSIACSFPTTSVPRDPKSGFIANGTFYDAPIGVCNGASAGEGICDAATRECFCQCKKRVNMDPDGEGLEPAYDGAGCTAPTAMLPADGFQINGGIVERLCNGRGTACPTGERLGEKRLDGTYLITVDSDFCRGKPDGCVCDNGYTGAACTVPVPYDEAASKPVFGSFGAYVPIRGGRHPVMNVYVQAENAYAGVVPLCTVTKVYVSDTTLKSDSNCTFTSDEGRYWCAGAYGTYVVVSTTEEHPSCSIKVYTENYDPCGNSTNPYMARLFANSVYRDYNRTDEFQSLVWAQHGGTSTECGCDPNHTGPLCLAEISGKRYDQDGTVSNRVCGETTFPPRGEVGTDGQCKCLFVAGYDFADSPGCACAKTPDGQRCGGVCTCLAPKFPFGVCEFDSITAASDALSSPFTQVAPPSAVRNVTYVVTSNFSVMEFQGRSWIVSQGQTFAIETAKGNISMSYDNARYPLNITHECGQPEDVIGPKRAIANVTVFEEACEYETGCTVTEYTTECDPAYSCPYSLYCGASGEYPCIQINDWMEDDEGEVLPSRRYVHARIIIGDFVPTLTQEDVDFPYGVFPTCADPVYRWLDASLVGAGMVETRQCTGGIGPHDNTLGQMYGVFDRVIPGLNFRAENWTDAQYDFVSSLMNNKVCVYPTTGKYVMDAMTDAVMDEYGFSLVRGLGVETEIGLGEIGSGSLLQGDWNTTRLTQDVAAWWGNAYWHLGTSLPFGPLTRWGGYVFLPKGQGEVRRVTIRNSGNTTVSSFALIGPRGETCVTYMKPFLPNETFTVDCGLSFETEVVANSMRRLYDQNLTEFSPNLTQWISPYVLLYSGTSKIEWRESDVGYTSRTTSYTERWRAISASILSEKVFPFNAPFETECLRLGGSLRSVTTAEDQTHLRAIHSGVLSPIRCTHDWECKRYAKGPNYKCVPDSTVPSEGWLNGDPTTGDDGIVGMEGGCDCRGIREIMDPQFHGSRCASGYEAVWTEVLAFETEARLRLPNFTEGYILVNISDWTDGTPKCVLPTSTSVGRPTDACGGARGKIVRDTYTLTQNITVYDSNKIKRCSAVMVAGSDVLEAHVDEEELDLHSFGNYRVNVINGRVFLDGEEVFSGVECIDRASSDTHRVLSYFGNVSIALQRRDAWTNFILEK